MKTNAFNYKEQGLNNRNRGGMKNAFKGIGGEKNKMSPTKIKRGISDIVETMDNKTKENMFQTFKSSHGGPMNFGVSQIQMNQNKNIRSGQASAMSKGRPGTVLSSGRSAQPAPYVHSDPPKFEKFVPRFEKEKTKKAMLDCIQDFQFLPEKFYCRKHSDQPIEYVSTLNETFFCKLCLPNFRNHDNVVLSDKYLQVQEQLVKLRHTYIEKREAVKSKLDA